MSHLSDSLVELIRRTSAEIPDDVHQAILAALENEKKNSLAANAIQIIDQNIALAKNKSQPICQDTGSILFYVDVPVGYDQIAFAETAREAVTLATKKGYLRQNSVDALTGKNDGTNVGPGAPAFHFHQQRSPEISVRLALKGGGCENVGAQYSLPDDALRPTAISTAAAGRSSTRCCRRRARAAARASSACASAATARRATNFPKRSFSAGSTTAIPNRSWTRWSRIF
jgi:tartrate dehydratase alpha subunit/fumarate hydratase class I-like protein